MFPRSKIEAPDGKAIPLVFATYSLVLSAGFLCISQHGILSWPSTWLSCFLVAHPLAIATTTWVLGLRAKRTSDEKAPNPVEAVVLVAAYNERDSIVHTVQSIASAAATSPHSICVVVVDDGSTDGTLEHLRRTLDSQLFRQSLGQPSWAQGIEVHLLEGKHQGKGSALERASLWASSHLPASVQRIAITVDADTTLDPHAISRILQPFQDSRVWAVGGNVQIRAEASRWAWIQRWEYLRFAFAREAWASVNLLDELPGAFMAFRLDRLREAGGFPEDSLTEDYEIGFRLRSLAAQRGESIRFDFAPTAIAFTSCPQNELAFVRQRTRWFAGFLSTLFRFRRALFDRKWKWFGLLRLPLKALDALVSVAALWLFLKLALAAVYDSLFSHRLPSLAQTDFREASVLIVFLVLDTLQIFSARKGLAPTTDQRFWFGQLLAFVVIDAFLLLPLRWLASLRGYAFALLRIRRWESARVRLPAYDGFAAPLVSTKEETSSSDSGASFP